MGMYTEFHFNSSIKKDCPDDVITILKFMTGQVDDFFDELVPDHKLFSTRAWSYMLRSDSYYFDSVKISKLNFNEMTKQYTICIICNLRIIIMRLENLWIGSLPTWISSVVATTSNLRGATKSCGCLRRDNITTHGMNESRIYQIWADMKTRVDLLPCE